MTGLDLIVPFSNIFLSIVVGKCKINSEYNSFYPLLQPPCKRPAYPQAGVEYSTTTPQINDEKSISKAATGQATNSIFFCSLCKKPMICLERANKLPLLGATLIFSCSQQHPHLTQTLCELTWCPLRALDSPRTLIPEFGNTEK